MMTDILAPPRPPTRVDHFLDVARREFLARGYHRVSVEGIARAAGVSKQTIYRRFVDKADILRAIAGQASDRFRGDFAVAPVAAGDVASVIMACALPVRAGFVAGDSRNLFRLDISIATRLQDLSRVLNDDLVASLAPIAAQLVELSARGQIRIDQPMTAAAQLGSLSVEGSRYLMGFSPPPSETVGAAAIVDLYLNGFAGRAIASYDAPPDEAELTPLLPRLHRDLRSYFPAADALRLTEAELQRLVGVARRKFFSAGYREASLEEIAVAARVGRGTLYRWFGGKEALFRVAMLHAAAEIGGARLPRQAGTPEQTLVELAAAASATLTGAVGTALYREVIAEADAFPELGRQVYRLSRAALATAVSDRLAAMPAGQGMCDADIAWAALQFLTIATDGNRYLSVDARLDAQGQRNAAVQTVDLFLNGRNPYPKNACPPSTGITAPVR